MITDVPEGYALIASDHPEGGPRGLRLGGEGILETTDGCWVARIRNRQALTIAERWVWIHDADAGAPGRYRRRAWLASGRDLPHDHGLEPTCGNPHCFRPAHQRLKALPKGRPWVDGRGEWVGEGEDEVFRWVPRKAASPRSGCRNRGQGLPKGSAHHKAKVTEQDVRDIRASASPRAELARRYGMSVPSIADIIKRKTWAHVA